eukprot:1137390-Pelagomonas_calceolata.AAC.3
MGGNTCYLSRRTSSHPASIVDKTKLSPSSSKYTEDLLVVPTGYWQQESAAAAGQHQPSGHWLQGVSC